MPYPVYSNGQLLQEVIEKSNFLFCSFNLDDFVFGGTKDRGL